VDFSGKTVLVRVDMNSPINPATGKVLSNTRITLHARTLKELADYGAKIVVLAHQGRKGDPDFVSLKSHAETLSKVLDCPVKYVEEVVGERVTRAITELKSGEILVLENVRFHPDEAVSRSPEEHAQSQLVKDLAALADIFVFDGFSVAHRSHATVVGFTQLLPSVAGRVVETELSVMDKVTMEVKKPFLCLLGGSKVEKGLDFVEFLLSKDADLILTGGVAGNFLLHAGGVNIGETNLPVLKKRGLLEHAVGMGEILNQNPGRIEAPVDVAVKVDDGRRMELKISELPSQYIICDIGSETVNRYVGAIQEAKTILATGPLGVYEEEAFAKGTFEVFKAIAESEAFSIASGGHTVSALRQFNLAEKFTYTSISGGAFLEGMMEKKLPGVECLKAAAERWKP